MTHFRLLVAAVVGTLLLSPLTADRLELQAQNSPRGTAAPGRPAETRRPGSPGRAPRKSDNPPSAAETAEPSESQGETKGMIERFVSFVRNHAVWIVIAIGLALAGVVWALWRESRGAPRGESPFEALGLGEKPTTRSEKRERFSSTKIQAAEVNDRLAGAVKTTEVETDREYALVVDEEALKMPPLPEAIDEHTGSEYAESNEIEKLLGERKYLEAYQEYLRRIQTDASLEFHSPLEKNLSEYFLRSRQLDEAARILEHHVATHAAEDISADTYFNLGYIHFLNQTPNKSRRFLKLFVESEENPGYVERAKKILDQLEHSGLQS